jgi:protocatechuate 4,5-dioxygenase, alpha chain
MSFPGSESLDPPDTFIYSGPMSTAGERINRFALSLKSPVQRTAFLADPAPLYAQHRLAEHEIGLIERRDWTGLLRAGGHLQAILKIAATVGESLWDIGAHSARLDVEEMKAICPRRVSGLPRGSR